VAADVDGAACQVPTLLITRLPGSPPDPPEDRRSFLTELASAMAAIHAVNGPAGALVPAYRRYHEADALVRPGWLPPSMVWDRAFELATEPAPEGSHCFIHRDYHPGNTLWAGGRLTGVVDWTQASWGPPSVDIGHMRWNLAVEFGVEMADQFLAAHGALVGDRFPHESFWDVVTVIDLVADRTQEALPAQVVARLEHYLAGVLGRL
jgi:aminoglycoside phosphotransferase (APT) family kinase protein